MCAIIVIGHLNVCHYFNWSPQCVPVMLLVASMCTSNITSMCAIILIDHLKNNSNVIGHLNDNSNVIGPINGNSNVIGPLNLCVTILCYVILNHAYCT